MKLATIGLGVLFAAACGEGRPQDPSAPDHMPVEDALLGAFVGTHAGDRVVGNYFTSKEDVYFGTAFEVGGPYAPIAKDYYFRVRDDDGRVLSTSALDCRRVFVDSNGSIATVYGGVVDGASCPHNSGRMGTMHGGVMVGLAPFDDGILHQGGRRYHVELSPTDATDGFEAAMRVTYFIGDDVPPGGVCGNGIVEAPEQCDDGNSHGGDGCDKFCVVEPGPVCGNGVVEDGEYCDDGNADNMDGCNVHCEVEHVCCCGNGILEPGESCDDGNTDDGDGCSSTCASE